MAYIEEKDLHELVNHVSLKHFDKTFPDEVVFNHRLRTTGGRYLPSKRKIELNPKYVDEMDWNEFIGIIKHELCHYHLHVEGKGFKHGDKAFKDLLKKTNSPRHCQPLPSMENRYKYTYICEKCHHVYKRIRRIDIAKYRCGKCKGRIILKDAPNRK